MVQYQLKSEEDTSISSHSLMISQGLDMCIMKYKSEAFDKFKECQRMVEKQTSKSIKALRSDRGGEYLISEFLNYLK